MFELIKMFTTNIWKTFLLISNILMFYTYTYSYSYTLDENNVDLKKKKTLDLGATKTYGSMCHIKF